MDETFVKIDYRKLKPGRPPVVVLGGLSQVWPLGFADIPVIIATSDLKNPALASRYLCGYCLLPSKTQEKATAIARLLRMGSELCYFTKSKIPLFCGNDDDLALTYEFRNSLMQNYFAIGNDPDFGLSLLEKDRFHALAREHGLPVPRVYNWDSDDTLAGIEHPVIVKPRRKEMWNHAPVFRTLFDTKGKAKLFLNGGELVAQPGLAAMKDQIIIQDYIPGDDSGIYSFHGFSDDQSELLEWFCGRKIRTFPKLTGESSFIELTKDKELFRIGRDIVRTLGLRGVFKMDFKKDMRDGQFYLLEINARFNLWQYLGAVNGVNIPRVAYEYIVHGSRPSPSVYHTKYKWQDFVFDYHAYRELAALGELNFWQWLESMLTTRHVQDIFLWKDPAPFVRWATSYIFERMDKWHSTAS